MPHIKKIIKFDNADNREYPDTQVKKRPVTAQKRLVTPNNFLGYLGILSILTQHTQNTISAFWVFWGSSSRRGLFELPRYPESGTYEKKATGFIWVFSPKYPNTQMHFGYLGVDTEKPKYPRKFWVSGCYSPKTQIPKTKKQHTKAQPRSQKHNPAHPPFSKAAY